MMMNSEAKQISYSVFGIAAILFLLATIFAFWNLSKVVFNSYPANDFSAHIVKIKFAREFGMTQNVTYWNNGQFKTGMIYGPAWYFYASIIDYFVSDVRLTFIITQVSLFILGFLGFLAYSRLKKFSLLKIITLYLLFFCSPLAIAYFLGLGSVGGLLGWVMIIFILTMIEKYKEISLNYWFFIIIPLFVVAILSHAYIAIVSLMILGNFLIYKLYTNKGFTKDAVIILLSIVFSVIITYFWWIDFFRLADVLQIGTKPFPYLSFDFSVEVFVRRILFTYVLPLVFIVVFWQYVKNLERKKRIIETVYGVFPLFISIIMLTRVLYFIPALNKVGFENLCLYVYLMALLILFDKGVIIQRKYYSLLVGSLVLISVIVGASFTALYYNSNFDISLQEKEAIQLVGENRSEVNKLVVLDQDISEYRPVQGVLNSYFAFEFNISTPQSHLMQITPISVRESIVGLKNGITNGDCELVKEKLAKLKTESVLTINIDCEKIISCSEFRLLGKRDNLCLFDSI